ncbi:MAG: aminotransferase class I/II-fold pyridoxal phosphate-dependent enzyme [Lachnospiraceae bacterium]|nr:aminotransferase class I/II-fold pyridoxal phosphate-dependent enzyme [Lachnospiraceae bacterium]MDE6895413.1 aminotransferase class I/II-fold pyridoxal phosphate-dependent enzyme [Lachnospiraceae bacterium]
MRPYGELEKEELLALKERLLLQYEEAKGKGLKLDMSRGKPAAEQLDMTMPMMDIFNRNFDMRDEQGVDVRNYGYLEGILGARRLLGSMLGVDPEHVIVFGTASLSVMYDTVSRSVTHGVMGSTPWCRLEKVKFLCPAPGYDRHFAITEHFGIEMITIPMKEDGPDMDLVEEYVKDPAVKGIWCVPMYTNPLGITYSEEVCRRMADLNPAAEDFRIYWDNAYCVHHLYEDKQDTLPEILSMCRANGKEDMVLIFASTSKISFAGAGISCIAASLGNLEWVKKSMTIQIISHDKINQLRHVLYFKDLDGIKEHMKKHAAIMRPKFDLVLEMLEKELGGLGIGSWTKPLGGYFISFDSMNGCAKAIVEKCREAGVTMTGAGATYPYRKDPHDSNIRIAPSYPTLEELKITGELFVLCVKLVSVEKLLENK